MVKAFAVLAAFVALACAKPHVARDMLLHDRRDAAPRGFIKSGPAPADTELRLRLALKQTDIEGLKTALVDVSTPSSANYGNHLSKEEVLEYASPKAETVDAVHSWLSENGLTAATLSPAGDWVGFTTTVAKANELFDADFSTFTHTATGVSSIRTLEYSIPAVLKGHLDLVHPTTSFSTPKANKGLPSIALPVKFSNVTADASASCSTITPSCVQSLYGIPTTLATQTNNQLAVAGFIDQYANSADLKTFLKDYRKDLPSTNTFTLQTLDGGSNPQSSSQAGVEADLDVQYTVGIASGVPTVFVSVGDSFQDGDLEGFLDIVNFLLAETNVPTVMTTSYGENESDMSIDLADKLCNAYATLGARGTSVLFASGDGGVSGSQSQDCDTFVPTFPSGCPYLTSVGATTGTNPETAASLSAGGFSNYFGIPSWQATAVSGYLTKEGRTNSGLYNASGRGYPDVAALGQNVEIIYQGKATAVDGTSCASPMFASVVALLNDKLIAAGKSPLGFLNPFLYSTGASALNDITKGDNPGCNTNGFSATTGWDPVTGLGSPNFAALVKAVGL
ncbi:family S53 protease [Artomyces pyxidatus]|uniref:Family S53 protease n=1 Tax=Artomyces pyxidatus TaxID=48021 RepID=A0ACB8T760_9AGAM|nr:family S53 protease [Artomyces pyxidatus]